MFLIVTPNPNPNPNPIFGNLSQFILHFYRIYCNYNVTTYPMKTVTTYPKMVVLLEVPVNQTPNSINIYYKYTSFSYFVNFQL